jgi:hypothetical protein
MTTEVPLSEFVTITLDGSGNGTAQLGPRAHGLVWKPTVASIKMTGDIPADLATVFVYAGGTVNDGNFVDSTYDVNSASSGNIAGQQLQLGQYVFAVWSGGNPGASATLTLNGTKVIA